MRRPGAKAPGLAALALGERSRLEPGELSQPQQVTRTGFEPVTKGLRVPCSAIEPAGHAQTTDGFAPVVNEPRGAILAQVCNRGKLPRLANRSLLLGPVVTRYGKRGYYVAFIRATSTA